MLDNVLVGTSTTGAAGDSTTLISQGEDMTIVTLFPCLPPPLLPLLLLNNNVGGCNKVRGKGKGRLGD